jgi:lactate permease
MSVIQYVHMFTVAALLPLLSFLILIIGLKKPVRISAFVTLIITIGIGLFVWGMEPSRIVASMFKGSFMSIEITLLLFGAIFLIELLRRKNFLLFLKDGIEIISQDPRVQTILIAWSLVYFIEGISGFGTPALIAVPLLIAIGFSPLLSVSLALIGNAASSIFGAIGLPITYGISSTIRLPESELIGFIDSLSLSITLFNVIGSVIIPTLLIYTLSRSLQKPYQYIIEFIPFILVVGSITSLTSIVTVLSIGPELVAITAGIASILTTIILSRLIFFSFQKTKPLLKSRKPQFRIYDYIKAILPYALLFFFLLLSRLPSLPFKQFLENAYSINIPILFGHNISYALPLFYSAGFIVCFSALISAFILKTTRFELKEICLNSYKKIINPALSLVSILAFVQIFIYSGENTSQLASMPLTLALQASELFGSYWIFIAPFVAALGSFVAGSTTVSNLIFSEFQLQMALSSNISSHIVLSLQGLGASAGNMIALHNIIAALAVAGIAGNESIIIKKNVPLLITYITILACAGVMIQYIV